MTTVNIPETMLAARWHGNGFEGLRVETVPVPRPGPGQLLGRVDAAGVCASNLKLMAQGPDHTFLNGWDPCQFPIQLGDEGCVTLVEVGGDLRDRYTVGKRYCLQPAVDHPPLHHLERYRDHARGMMKCAIGYTLPGHLAQYILITEETIAAGCVLPLPSEDLPFYATALCEPISCVISAQDRHIHIVQDSPQSARKPVLGLKPNGVTVVVGVGPMGRLHAEAALRYNPRALVVADVAEARLNWINEVLGPRCAQSGVRLLSVLSPTLPETIRSASEGAGADDIIVAVGVRSVQIEAQRWLARGGVLNLFGGLKRGEHVIDLDTLRVHYDEIKVVGSSGGSPADIAETLRMLAERKLDPSLHLALVGSLHELPRALQMVKNTETEGKIVLYPHLRPTPLTPAVRWTGERESQFLKDAGR